MGPKVSVLMPTHRGGPMLEEAVRSIIGQTYENWELIILEDGCEVSVPDDPRIVHLFNMSRKGIPWCLNRCIEHATGDLFCRQDSDDVSISTRLEMLVAAVQEGHPFVTSRCCRIDPNGIHYDDEWMIAANMATAEGIRRHIHDGNLLVGGAPMWTRRVMDEVGVFDETLTVAQDYNFWIRVLREFPIYIVDPVLYLHRLHPGSHRNDDYLDADGRKIDFQALAQERAACQP